MVQSPIPIQVLGVLITNLSESTAYLSEIGIDGIKTFWAMNVDLFIDKIVLGHFPLSSRFWKYGKR